jgi:transcriptional regulator with XRE-family HTH domain
MTSASWQRLAARLRDKAYRDAFVEEWIDTGLPFQIHATRQARGWTQQQLADRAGMTQTSLSRLENPNYARCTLATLKRLASALDVALFVRFVPFSRLAGEVEGLSPESLAVPSYVEEFDQIGPAMARREQPDDEASFAVESQFSIESFILRFGRTHGTDNGAGAVTDAVSIEVAPHEAKTLLKVLDRQIHDYEASFGPIDEETSRTTASRA